MSDESVKPHATSDNSLAPSLNHTGFRTRISFAGLCSKQDKVTSFFWSCKLTKNADFDNYKYSGYGIGFDAN